MTAHPRWMTTGATLLVSVLITLAGARLLDAWGYRELARHGRPSLPEPVTLVAASSPAEAPASPSEAARLMGIVNDRAYFRAGATILSLSEGDRLPAGTAIARVDQDRVRTVQGEDISLFPRSVTKAGERAAAGSSPGTPAAVRCALSERERAQAIFIEPSVAQALLAERAAFARVFAGEANGVRARSTAGVASTFGVIDGDVLVRADGVPLKDANGVLTQVIGKVAAGGSVVIEGERGGQLRRWVVAATGCRG